MSNHNGAAYKIIVICIIPVMFFMGKIMYAEGEKWREADKEILSIVDNKVDKILLKVDETQKDITSINVAIARLARCRNSFTI